MRPMLFIAAIFIAVAAVTVASKFWTPAEKIAWRDDLDAALRDANAARKPVLLYFTASWCGPCQDMRRSVWSDDRVAAALASYLPVRIDIDGQRALARKYDVQAVPMIAVLDAQGAVARSTIGGMSADEMIEWLARR